MNKELLKSIHQDVAGIIWISADPLTRSTLHFNEIDYLLDGLISRRITNNVEFNKKTNLLLSKSFGEQFFVLHTCQNDVQLSSYLDLIQKTNRSIIKVINTTEKQHSINHKTYRFEKL
jgi:hypothetical protein